MSDDDEADSTHPEGGEDGDGEAVEGNTDPTPEDPSEGGESTPKEGGSEDLPDIEDDEQATVPDGLDAIDPEEVEAEAGASSDDADESDDDQGDEQGASDDGGSDPESMEPDSGGGASPLKAGDTYVSLVQSVTNAQIRKHGGADAGELDRDHFEQYDLAEHFNETMDYMGVGSDLEPHEALLLATVLSVGDGMVQETDVLDRQLDQLMEKAINGGAA